MMNKTIIQGLITVILFFSLWFGLMQIDWYTVFKIQKVTDKTEEKLGDLIWKSVQQNEIETENLFVLNSIDSIVNKICIANNIDREYLKIHIFDKEEINAFALPNGHLVIYTGLILNAENQEELSGVICHEIAHIQLNHVMKKLVKEIGLASIISLTTGNGGGSVIMSEILKTLSSSAFDRSLEKEADIKAVDYLVKAKINPEPFANFLYKLAMEEDQTSEYLSWMSTHPDSKERSEYIIEYSKYKKAKFSSIITTDTWNKVKEEIQKESLSFEE